MSYCCADCSHKGNRFPGGGCPACGSNNVKRQNAGNIAKNQMKARGPFKQALNFTLWLMFGWLVYDSYYLINPPQAKALDPVYQVTESGSVSAQD